MEVSGWPIEDFFNEVMGDLGYRAWSLRWQVSDAYCWRTRKIIDICPMDSEVACKQMLLHEIAHIDIVEAGDQHSPRFFVRLTGLVRRYLNQGLDGHQRKMKAIYLGER